MRAARTAPMPTNTAPTRRAARRPSPAPAALGPLGLWRYVRSGSVGSLLSAPLIYSLFVPLALLDAWVLLYQVICFRAWDLRAVRRRDYFAIDRHRLPYLNGIEKVNCLFCSYANGLLAYVHEVASRTEQYWCPIKHGRRVRGAHHRYAAFAAYGDARTYRERLAFYRAALTKYTSHS
jgi:hypothetical protein